MFQSLKSSGKEAYYMVRNCVDGRCVLHGEDTCAEEKASHIFRIRQDSYI